MSEPSTISEMNAKLFLSSKYALSDTGGKKPLSEGERVSSFFPCSILGTRKKREESKSLPGKKLREEGEGEEGESPSSGEGRSFSREREGSPALAEKTGREGEGRGRGGSRSWPAAR